MCWRLWRRYRGGIMFHAYKINMSFEDEGMEEGIGRDSSYVCSLKEYTNEEFTEICKKALKNVEDKHDSNDISLLVDELEKNFGFTYLRATAFFDYECKE